MDSNMVNIAYAGAAVSGLVVAGFFYYKYQRAQRRKLYPKDVVILHQFPRGLRAPSASSFCLKLETWLRIADVKYENEYGYARSAKYAIPWITFNGVDVADSQFSIEYLSKKLDKNLNANLTDEQKAVGRAVFKLTEESLKWPMMLRRYVYNPDPKEAGTPRILSFIFKGRIQRIAYGQGYGRHTEQEVYEIGKADLKAINDIIGKNKFVLGNEPSEVDACVFGQCVQVLYHDFGPLHYYLKDECPNIIRFVQTVKETYWPDWNTVVKQPN